MNEIILLILAVLSAWRLTELLVFDTIFLPLREYFGIAHNGRGVPLGRLINNNFLRDFVGDVLSCIRCTSVWVGFFLVLLLDLLIEINLVEALLMAFSLSQTTIVLNSKLTV